MGIEAEKEIEDCVCRIGVIYGPLIGGYLGPGRRNLWRLGLALSQYF